MIATSKLDLVLNNIKYRNAPVTISFAHGIHDSGAIRVIHCILDETGENIFNLVDNMKQREIRMACHAKLQEILKK